MGFSYQEAADIMKVPIGTIRSRISRGRETLRELILAAEDEELPLAQ
jgi:RNA polymerase sigma-70 factor (ECF subfamily)